MLIKCPECDLQISDKAAACPHCGYPLLHSSSNIHPKKTTPKRTVNKRRRLPNGFGQITELKGMNLRKPFRASVTVGKDEDGRCIKRLLKPEAYFKTYNDAYAALLEYHSNPFDFDKDLTMQKLYELWNEKYLSDKASSTGKTLRAAWRYCSTLYELPVRDVRGKHIRYAIENGTAEVHGEIKSPSPDMKCRIKSVLSLMLDYAVENDLVSTNCARTFSMSGDIIKERESKKKDHIPYTEEEMKILWKNAGLVEWVDVVLIQCYSGWRPRELGRIELENVDIENWTFKGGMKTDAGVNRLIPIHPKIRKFVEQHYKKAKHLNSKYLFNCTDIPGVQGYRPFDYDRFRLRYQTIVEKLSLSPEHRPHDGRKHFITMAKKYEVDEYAIKYVVGHKITDVTEAVYTVREPAWLASEIAKIK